MSIKLSILNANTFTWKLCVWQEPQSQSPCFAVLALSAFICRRRVKKDCVVVNDGDIEDDDNDNDDAGTIGADEAALSVSILGRGNLLSVRGETSRALQREGGNEGGNANKGDTEDTRVLQLRDRISACTARRSMQGPSC